MPKSNSQVSNSKYSYSSMRMMFKQRKETPILRLCFYKSQKNTPLKITS